MDKVEYHFEGVGNWQDAGAHICVFVEWAAARGLVHARLAAMTPAVRKASILEVGGVVDHDLTEDGRCFARAAYEAYADRYAPGAQRDGTPGVTKRLAGHDDDEARAWLETRFSAWLGSLGAPLRQGPSDPVEAVLARARTLGLDEQVEGLRAIAGVDRALSLLRAVTPPQALTLEARWTRRDNPDIHLGDTPCASVDALVAHDVNDVDPHQVLLVFGDAACVRWMTQQLMHLCPTRVDAEALRVLVASLFFVRIQDPGNGRFPEGCIITRRAFEADCSACDARGVRPGVARHRLVGIDDAAWYELPFEERCRG